MHAQSTSTAAIVTKPSSGSDASASASARTGSGSNNGSGAPALEQELERLRLETSRLRAENERLRVAQEQASQSQSQSRNQSQEGASNTSGINIGVDIAAAHAQVEAKAEAGGDIDDDKDDDDSEEASMDSDDAEDAVMKAIMSNGALSAMVQQSEQQQQQQQQLPPQSSDYVDFASYPTGHRYGGLLSDKGSVSARANFAPQLEVDVIANNNNSSGSPNDGAGGGSRKEKKRRMPSILRRSSYQSTSNSNIGSSMGGSLGNGSSMGNSTRSIGMRIDSESDADGEADNKSATSAGSRGSKGSRGSSGSLGMRRNTVHIGEMQRQKRKEEAQSRQLRLQSGGRAAASLATRVGAPDAPQQTRTTYPPRRSTRSSIAILRTRGSVASASLAAPHGGHHRGSVTSYDDLVDPTLALRRSENKHGSAEKLMFGQTAAAAAAAGGGGGAIDTDAAVHGRRSKEKFPEEDQGPIIEGGPGSHHKVSERDLSRFRRTSVRSILTIDSATLDDDDGSLPSDDDDDDGAKAERVVVAASPSTPIDISAEEEKAPALSHVASQPVIDSSVGDAPSHARPVVQRHASMDMGGVFLPDSNASVVSSRSRRSSAMPLGGMHASLETCNYDGSSFRSRVTAITRDGEGEETTGPEPPRRRAVKRMSQSMRRVSFSGHVQSLLDERLEMYISSMIGNTTNMHKQDEQVSFDKFALLSVKSATLAAPPPVEMSSGTDIDRFIHEGPRYLDSFFLDTADLLDEYPKKDVDGGNEADLDPMALSTFCFPDGLKVRVVPRAAMEGAKRLGWTGRKADRSHLLVFTDDKGETRNGIAITVRAETASSSWDKVDIIKSLNQRRKMRIASTTISRWYRRLRASQKPRGSPRQGVVSPGRGLSHTMSVRSDFGRRGHSSESLSSKPVRRVHSIDAISTLSGGGSSTGGGANADWGDVDSTSLATDKSGKSNKSLQKRATRKMMKTLGLKKSRDRSDSIDDGSKSSNKKRSGLRKKVARFTEMTSGTRPLASGGTSVSVTEADDDTQVSVNTYSSKEKKPLSDWAKENGKESYAAMIKASGLGDVAIVEQCYVMIGGRADDQSILHNALQQLVNYEREEALLRFCGRKNGILQEGQARTFLPELDSSGPRRPSLGDRNEIDQSFRDYTSRLVSRRHNNLKFIQAECKLSREQITYCLNGADPLDELNGIGRRFQLQLPVRNSTKIDLPLPLPKIGKEWGFAKLLLSIGPDSTLLALKLLLLERSILVLGDKPDEVTAICRALLRLIKPFKWASTFMPVLPFAMLDFVNSPVPFVAGMSIEGDHAMQLIEDDIRVMEAQTEGMSIINLKAGALLITSERGIGDKLSLSSTLRKKIHALHRRLSFLAEKKDSSIHSLEKFCKLGASPLERLTLQSASSSIEEYFGSLLGDVASGDGWLERYGKIDEASGEYLFHAEWMIEALRAEMRFQEDLVQTQLFHSFVDLERTKIQEIEQARSGDAARFIADWLKFRWKRRNG